jgi:AraC-like DNA-binding protein
MPLFEPTVPARYTAPLLEALREERPLWLAAELASAGLDSRMLHDPGATLTMAQFDALLTAMAKHTGRADLGFELGSRITWQHHGALGAAVSRCETVNDLLRLLARYNRLITPSFFLHFRRRADQGEFIWRPAAPMSAATLRMIEEVFAVSFHKQLSAALGQRPPQYDTYLSMPAPRHAARYRELRPARFHFGYLPLPEVRVAMDATLLGTPLGWTDQGTAQAKSADLGGLQQGIRRAKRWSDWVVMMLREAEGTQPTLRELAELLSVSPRTLTRKLADEDQTLRDLAKDVRHARACAMLKDARQPIGQIAWRLGYGDPTNFTHAFCAVAGISPSKYRTQHPEKAANRENDNYAVFTSTLVAHRMLAYSNVRGTLQRQHWRGSALNHGAAIHPSCAAPNPCADRLFHSTGTGRVYLALHVSAGCHAL